MKIRLRNESRSALQTACLCALFACSALAVPPGKSDRRPQSADETVITISDEVVTTGIEPLGVNLTTIAGGTNLATNNLIRGSGMEPATDRYLVRVERAGDNWIEWDQSLGGVHMWEQNATGFGDGSSVRFYRIVDSTGEPLSYSNGADLSDNTGANRVVFLGETTVPAGGWIAEGVGAGKTNRVYLTTGTLRPAYGDHAIFTVTKTRLSESEVHPRLLEWFDPQVGILGAPEGGTATLVAHPGVLPPEFSEPGDTCLELYSPEPYPAFVGQYLFHGHDGGEGQWYSQLEPGAPYRVEVWLRQQDLPEGHVRFAATGPYEPISQDAPWSVSGEWAQYVFDFTGPPYPSPDDGHAALGLEITGPGTVWVDNFVVYRHDAEHGFRPFTPNRVAFDEVMAAMPESGPKPAIRFYADTYFGHSPMKRLLSNYPSSHIDFIYNIQPTGPEGSQAITVPQALEWCLATGARPAERCVPYLTLPEEYTEVEWLQLMEFLGVPWDPSVDTPEQKPWAHLRSQQRGVGTPWTEEFREIVIEFGNETWHAGFMAGWDGFGRPFYVHQGGREYGLFARHYFTEHVAAHPWWTQYSLAGKIRFSLNANYDADPEWAYGEQAAKAAPEATSYLGHANYVGPKWETGDTPYATFDDHGMQETLVGAFVDVFPLIDQIESTRDAFRSAGLADYRPAAYEGGPSGYYLPGVGTPDQVANSQLYGKSLGMAVSALDAWLYSSLKGYGHQFLWAFRSGANWTSHTMPRAGGFRRHSAWLALMMRNRHAPGNEMLRVTVQNPPTYAREEQVIPLVSAYAVRGPQSLSVFVLSRNLDGNHDGVDFGDGSTSVTLVLPIANCTALTRFALTAPDGSPADPRANNLDAENVVLSSLEISPKVIDDGVLVVGPATGGIAGGMPPGTVFLYTFELALPTAADRLWPMY